MHSVLRSALARALSFVPIAVATLLTSRLIIQHYGIGSFDSYALIVSLIFLIPLNNLGVGASVTSSYAADGPQAEHARRVTVTAARVLTLSTVGTAAAALLLGAFGWWPTLLGAASGPSGTVGVAIALYAVSFVPGLGQNMLLGVNRNHVTVLVQAAFAPFILLGVVGVLLAGADRRWLLVVPTAAMLAVTLLTASVAARTTGVSWAGVLRAVPFPRRFPGARIRQLSGPVLISTLANPIALQSDRIVLSHVSTEHEVATYSLVVQIIAPAMALVAAAAQPLWPIFTKARADGADGPGLSRVLALFGAAGAALGLVAALLANPIAALIGGSKVHSVGILLPVAGALTIVTAALAYPVAMHLMDPAGARFVALATCVALPLNLGASIWLASWLGAPGPLLGTVIVGLLVQTGPAVIYARNRHRVGRHRVGAAPHLVVFDELPVVVETAGAARGFFGDR